MLQTIKRAIIRDKTKKGEIFTQIGVCSQEKGQKFRQCTIVRQKTDQKTKKWKRMKPKKGLRRRNKPRNLQKSQSKDKEMGTNNGIYNKRSLGTKYWAKYNE